MIYIWKGQELPNWTIRKLTVQFQKSSKDINSAKDTEMPNKHIKRCIREMQFKNTMRNHNRTIWRHHNLTDNTKC